MRQIQGRTLTSMLIVAVLIVILAVFFMKIVPIYINHYQVKQAVSSISRASSRQFTNDLTHNAQQVRRILMNQLHVNSIVGVQPKNIVIKPITDKQFEVIIDYEVKKKIIANISILVNFKIDQEVDINAP